MDHTRHAGIFDASRLSVSLIGAGGIGAMTALMLAKMGVANLVVYDDDTVSPENLPTQLHRLGTEGELKVEALQKTLALFSDDTTVHPNNDRITSDKELYGHIVISAVDSIAARKAIWQAVDNGGAGWYIDARMSAEEFQRFAVEMNNPASVAKYAAMLAQQDDSQVADIPCTAKATFYCSAISAAHLGADVRKIATGIKPDYQIVQNMLHNRFFAIKQP